MDALTSDVQQLCHLFDCLTAPAFKYFNATSILPHIVRVLKRFQQLPLLCCSQAHSVHGIFLLLKALNSV
jgi:hypothetical protein